MERKSWRLRLAPALLAVAWVSPLPAAEAPLPAGGPPPPAATAAPRLYGNMPLIIDPTPRDRLPFHFAAHHIAEDSSLLVVHTDFFPVPWRELAAGEAPPEAWSREMDAIRGLQERVGLPVYLALTPIEGSRDRLKFGASGTYALTQDESRSVVCEPIDQRPDYQTVIRPGYRRYVTAMIDRFQPRFVALSIEVNLYAMNCPAAWPAMKRLINETYDMVKARYRSLPAFQTFQVDALWQARDQSNPCFGFRRDCLHSNFAPLADLKTDLFAISSYPIDTYLHNGRQLPDDYLTALAKLSGKPLAVAETGYQAATFSGVAGGACFPGLPSSPADQAWWMGRLLADAERARMPFVVWWADEDLMPETALEPCDCQDGSVWCQLMQILDQPGRDSLRFFGTMGLRAFDGTPRPALDLWTAAVARSRGGQAAQ
ncbi:MAG TPA: hypothetical protein VHG32_07820 [Thermoanaerobaculia bacterium]|nr:hypothetical protein [Thermoanaerobaculia bacterium]